MQLADLSWRQATEHTHKVLVIPLGSQEQHGHHLPLATDALIGSAISDRAEAMLADEALFLPMLWLGCSPHHLKFCGTVSVSSATYMSLIEDIAESLIAGGFRKLFFLNSHAGNVGPATVALNNVQLRHADALPDLYLTFSSWFTVAAKALAALEGFRQTKLSHACEWETSQIMAIRPELVGDSRPAARFETSGQTQHSRFFCADYATPSAVEVMRRIDQGSPTGTFGWPELATREKGEALIETAATEVAAFVREFATWPANMAPPVSSG